MTRRSEGIEVQSNLVLTMRERGKVVARRRGHNIWLNLGREYLASLLAYSAFSPLTPERDDRIRYMGFGIGGNRQNALGTANGGALVLAYQGSNAQTDTNPEVRALERPVRISGGQAGYPGEAGDVWIGQVQAPAEHQSPTEVTFRRLLSELDISYDPYLSVPLSEIGLFTNAADPNIYNNTAVAYDTFDTWTKTNNFELEIAWSVRF